MPNNLVTIEELMRRFSIKSRSTVYRWARIGIVRIYKPYPHCHISYFDPDEVSAAIRQASQQRATAQPPASQ